MPRGSVTRFIDQFVVYRRPEPYIRVPKQNWYNKIESVDRRGAKRYRIGNYSSVYIICQGPESVFGGA